MTADWKSLCAELLRGLDENRHPEVCYPGHLRVAMATARAAILQVAKWLREQGTPASDWAIHLEQEATSSSCLGATS